METKWEGNVRDLVARVAGSDARETFVDVKTGAKIRINIDGGSADEDVWGKAEPFYIESADGEDLYDAYNRKEAVMILSNIRKGKKYPDQPDELRSKRAKGKRKSVKKSRKSSSYTSLGGMR